jgi:hypothetical protein
MKRHAQTTGRLVASAVGGLTTAVLYYPLRFRLWVRGTRYHALPFEAWHKRCPLCGGTYRGHSKAALGIHVAPARELQELVRCHRWEDLAARGFPGTVGGLRDAIGAVSLHCPIARKVAVFVFLSRLSARNPDLDLLHEETLDDEAARSLVESGISVIPAVEDRLKSRVAQDRQMLRDLWKRLRGKRSPSDARD